MHINISQRLICATVGLCLSFSVTLHAQPMADRTPDNALIYIGWPGTDALDPVYRQSLAHQYIQQIGPIPGFQAMIDGLAKISEAQEPGLGKAFKQAMAELQPALAASTRYPTAIYVMGINMQTGISMAMLCQAGDDADQVKKAYVKAHQAMDVGMGNVIERDGLVCMYFGPQPLLTPGMPLSANARFKARARSLIGQDTTVLYYYLDAKRLIAMLEMTMGVTVPEQYLLWQQFKEATGLGAVNQVHGFYGFADRQFRTATLVGLDTYRTGLLNAIQQQPIDPAMFKLIPATADSAMIVRMELLPVFQSVLAWSSQMDPQTARSFLDVLDQIKQTCKIDLETDLLRRFGSHWIVFNDSSIAGNNPLGMVLINDADDAEQLSRNLEQLINGLSVMGVDATEKPLKVRQLTRAGHTLRCLPLPGITPSWTVHNGRLLVGLYPQTVLGAMALQVPEDQSIAAQPAFAKRYEQLAEQKALWVDYVDTRQAIDQCYAEMVITTNFFNGVFQAMGFALPPVWMPAQPRLRQMVQPGMTVIQFNEQGLMYQSIEAFPGATFIAAPLPGLLRHPQILLQLLIGN